MIPYGIIYHQSLGNNELNNQMKYNMLFWMHNLKK